MHHRFLAKYGAAGIVFIFKYLPGFGSKGDLGGFRVEKCEQNKLHVKLYRVGPVYYALCCEV